MNGLAHQRVVILGAGYAGQLAATRLGNARLPIDLTVVEPRQRSVERVRLHQLAAGQRLPERRLRELLRRTGATIVEGRAELIDPDRQLVHLETPDGFGTVGYDWLIVATGSQVDRRSVPGAAAHGSSLDDPREVMRLRDELPALARRSGRLLVVGGGLTGIEAASELAEAYPGLDVELVDSGSLEEHFSAAGAAHLRRTLARLGVRTRERTRVRELGERVAVLDDGETIGFDRCLWSAGFRAPALAADSGLPVDALGRLRTDRFLRVTGYPNILAAGDAGAACLGGRAPRMCCAVAMPMGAHAAGVVAALLRGDEPDPFDFGFQQRCISLGRRDGLIQFVRPDDQPKDRILTGRLAALTKELILRGTIWLPAAERRLGRDLYWWAGGETAEGERGRVGGGPARTGEPRGTRIEVQAPARAQEQEAADD